MPAEPPVTDDEPSSFAGGTAPVFDVSFDAPFYLANAAPPIGAFAAIWADLAAGRPFGTGSPSWQCDRRHRERSNRGRRHPSKFANSGSSCRYAARAPRHGQHARRPAARRYARTSCATQRVRRTHRALRTRLALEASRRRRASRTRATTCPFARCVRYAGESARTNGYRRTARAAGRAAASCARG